MAVGKEIRTKISSIRSTQKITSAMEMVAASKMRRAQDRMAVGKPYARRIRAVVGHIANAAPEYKHMYMEEREVRRVGYIVVSTDRGLCGGLNINLFKSVIATMRQWEADGLELDLTLIGSKSAAFFKRLGKNIASSATHLGDAPSIVELIGTIKVMLDAYEDGKIDRLYLAHNQFVNTMTQSPQITQLIPVHGDVDKELETHWDYIYEPDAKELLEKLLTRYIESQVYQAVVENGACEQAARMLAMKNATENAGEIIDDLQLIYNKARQAAITQELSEIVSGAAAIG